MFWFMMIVGFIYNISVVLAVVSVAALSVKGVEIWKEKHPDITLPKMSLADKIITVLKLLIICGIPVINLAPTYLAVFRTEEFCDELIRKMECKYLNL